MQIHGYTDQWCINNQDKNRLVIRDSSDLVIVSINLDVPLHCVEITDDVFYATQSE